jgi:hypothetical protein
MVAPMAVAAMTSVRLFAFLLILGFVGCAVTRSPKMGDTVAPLKVQIVDSGWIPITNFIGALLLGGDVTGLSNVNKLAAIQGYPVSTTTPAANGKMLCTSGGQWAPCATPSAGPTPAAAPTAIAGLPTCNVAALGLQASVTDQNCAGVTFHATPVATAGVGCQTNLYCFGAPTASPTPAWVIY